MTKLNPSFSRRNLLLGTLQGAGFFLLSGCEKVFDSLSRRQSARAAFAYGPQQARPGIQRQRYLAKISRQRQPTADHYGLRGGRKKSVDELAA